MALCKNPIFVKSVGGLTPCGQCFTCRLNKARFWTFRLCMEAMLHEKTWWTTITYNNEFLPLESVDPTTGELFGHPRGTLNRTQIDLFLKRVRKRLSPHQKFRYFLVGEYGDTDQRPHYHVCIFGYGEEIQRVLELCWTDPVSKRPFGFIDRKKSRPLDTSTARYTCGYTLKKLNKKDDPRLEGRYPEFISSSNGIGIEFAKRFADSLRNKSGAAYILTHHDIPRTVRFDGKNWPLDRYLRQKILDHLGLTEPLGEAGVNRFAKEMRSLQIRAELNPKFSGARSITPAVMRQQYLHENAQKILNTEKRAQLKLKEKPL